METEINFFSRDQTRRNIQKFLEKFGTVQTEDAFEQERNQHIKLILNNMLSIPEQWNSNCTININWIGNNFISLLSDEKDVSKKNYIDDVYSMCFRFLLELYFSIKSNFTIEYEQARRFASKSLDRFTDDAKNQIEFALKDMPIVMLKVLITHENIDSIKDFNKTADNADRMRKEWTKELEEKTIEVKQLKENLDKYKAAFNFVGLYQGFDELSLEKNKEKVSTLNYLKLFGALIIFPVISEIVFIMCKFQEVDKYKSTFLILLIPTVSLIGLLVYYFRIILHNYNSVKSQLLQLELRKTLCRFIQNYVDYSTEIKKKDKESLTKFENIVFSGLVTNDEKLPSTFDGVEQIANLIKSVKT